ncbi:cytochrome P450 family protein [Actinoallomurus rhizosphaericola]|uniref:cytochrome P450 family protein n=1 Tax=Actinoallomurus rhizosphaericola TaxID=2952536 RepID=UPI0020937D7E|nr:cytochrome P450 [Actinoallomurus rhizosphaericola]MCO5996741.1 cytochrome P450 [Actinoallomurus rhizosphaericola]
MVTPVTVDLSDPELLRDPFRGYSRLREQSPMVQVVHGDRGSSLWIVTRHADVRVVLNDRRFVNDPANVPGMEIEDARAEVFRAMGIDDDHAPYLLRSVLDADGDDHLRLRRLVSRAFTARRVTALLPRVGEIVGRLLDRLPDRASPPDGVVDLLEHFAYPLPITVICELVGIPEEDRERWLQWSRALMRSHETGHFTAAIRGIVDHVEELVARRRAEPADDLLTALIGVHDEDGGVLSEFELVTMVLTIVLAGHETTAHLIGNGMVALLTHRDQLDLLRADPATLLPRAVQELMRWCGPVQAARVRYATEDVEIGGRRLRKGSPVMASLVSANFDPRRFADPHRLDITRQPDGGHETHLGFGHGLHYCLGAALARQEAEVAFAGLLDRYPGLSLAVPPESLDRIPMPGTWRLAALPVRLTSPPAAHPSAVTSGAASPTGT